MNDEEGGGGEAGVEVVGFPQPTCFWKWLFRFGWCEVANPVAFPKWYKVREKFTWIPSSPPTAYMRVDTLGKAQQRTGLKLTQWDVDHSHQIRGMMRSWSWDQRHDRWSYCWIKATWQDKRGWDDVWRWGGSTGRPRPPLLPQLPEIWSWWYRVIFLTAPLLTKVVQDTPNLA